MSQKSEKTHVSTGCSGENQILNFKKILFGDILKFTVKWDNLLLRKHILLRNMQKENGDVFNYVKN